MSHQNCTTMQSSTSTFHKARSSRKNGRNKKKKRNNNSSSNSNSNNSPKEKKKTKIKRTANVIDDIFIKSKKEQRQQKKTIQRKQRESLLPPNQYEAVLRRRAIRKIEDQRQQLDSNIGSTTTTTITTRKVQQQSIRGIRSSPSSTRQRRRSVFGKNMIRRERHSAIIHQEQGSDDDTIIGDKHEYSYYEQVEDEEYGDISLGMKLTILGGRVIVQHLNSLSDGRASPAQLSGLIQRGDVLLSVENVSIINLPIDQLMAGLNPLSKPIAYDNSYQRVVRLRFAIGEGLSLLQNNDRTQQQKQQRMQTDPAPPVFSFLPPDGFVDQLSGSPINFDVYHQPFVKDQGGDTSKPSTPNLTPKRRNKGIGTKTSKEQQQSLPMSIDKQISIGIANRRELDRQRYNSEFFAWNNKYSDLLRPSSSSALIQSSITEDVEDDIVLMTTAEMLGEGIRAMVGAKTLCYTMEDIDNKAGRNKKRPISKLTSNLSIRSRKVEQKRQQSTEEGEYAPSDESDAGSETDDEEELNGVNQDQILVGLAAHDEIWRSQVIETLESATREMEEEQRTSCIESSTVAASKASMDDDNNPLAILLGGQVSRMLLDKTERSFSLPPKEATNVLYDLIKIITVATTPDEITLTSGSNKGQQQPFNHNSNLMTAAAQKVMRQHPSTDKNGELAKKFVVDDVFPAWLKSFRPLPWIQRRMLWHPHGADHSHIPHTIHSHQSITLDDGLTLDSGSFSNAPRAQSLQEQIEDLALDPETREETCDLLTFYFTQVVLPKIGLSQNVASSLSESEVGESPEKKAIDFVAQYGAYLELHASLVRAASIESSSVISSLLSLAQHDLFHQMSMKEILKANFVVETLVYESPMLSATLKLLDDIRFEKREEQRRSLIGLCGSAFPDVRPWQVQKACLNTFTPYKETNKEMENDGRSGEYDCSNLYYEYLSLLLDPLVGHEMARRTSSLVDEWCKLSAQVIYDSRNSSKTTTEKLLETRRKNFFTVALREGSYDRNLLLLLNLSMNIGEHHVALDIAEEVIQHPSLSKDKAALSTVLSHLQTISNASLTKEVDQQQSFATLRRVFRCFHSMGKLKVARETILVPDELYSLLLSCRNNNNGGNVRSFSPTKKELAFIDLVSTVAAPTDSLQMVSLWTSCNAPSSSFVLPAIHQTMFRGAKVGVHKELSGALLRIGQARLENQSVAPAGSTGEESKIVSSHKDRTNIWRRMHQGTAFIEK